MRLVIIYGIGFILVLGFWVGIVWFGVKIIKAAWGG